MGGSVEVDNGGTDDKNEGDKEVTSIACLRMSFSGQDDGGKLMIASNDRWLG